MSHSSFKSYNQFFPNTLKHKLGSYQLMLSGKCGTGLWLNSRLPNVSSISHFPNFQLSITARLPCDTGLRLNVRVISFPWFPTFPITRFSSFSRISQFPNFPTSSFSWLTEFQAPAASSELMFSSQRIHWQAIAWRSQPCARNSNKSKHSLRQRKSWNLKRALVRAWKSSVSI